MKVTILDRDGTVRCPYCGATSFSSHRTTKSKVGFGLLALLAAPKLRCNGCGHSLKPGNTTTPHASPPESPAQSEDDFRALINERRAERG